MRPKQQKARALIALLACAPNLSRSRDWVKAHLWSASPERRAATSLRQEIWRLRKLMPSSDRLVQADQCYLWLQRRDVCLAPAGTGGDAEFLEGIDIRDEAFEEWLRVQRSRAPAEILAEAGAIVEAVPRPGPQAAAPPKPSLMVMPAVDLADCGLLRRLAETIADQLVLGLFSARRVTLFDLRETAPIVAQPRRAGPPEVDFVLRLKATKIGRDRQFLLELTRAATGEVVMVSGFPFQPRALRHADADGLADAAAAAVKEIHQAILPGLSPVPRTTSVPVDLPLSAALAQR